MGQPTDKLQMDNLEDIGLVRMLLKRQYSLPEGLRGVMVSQLYETIQNTKSERIRLRSIQLLGMLDRIDQQTLFKAIDKRFPDKFDVSTDDDDSFRRVMQEVHSDPDYAEYLRQRDDKASMGQPGADSDSDDGGIPPRPARLGDGPNARVAGQPED